MDLDGKEEEKVSGMSRMKDCLPPPRLSNPEPGTGLGALVLAPLGSGQELHGRAHGLVQGAPRQLNGHLCRS